MQFQAEMEALLIFGIVGVMEIDMVAKELTPHWMVAELVMHQRLRK